MSSSKIDFLEGWILGELLFLFWWIKGQFWVFRIILGLFVQFCGLVSMHGDRWSSTDEHRNRIIGRIQQVGVLKLDLLK